MADLDRAAFGAWLAAQAPEAVVGYSGEPTNCPLKNFDPDGIGSVGIGRYLDGDGLPHDLPAWAAAFVDAVDDLPPPASDDDGIDTPITAAEALSILAEVR